eukprot:449030_1
MGACSSTPKERRFVSGQTTPTFLDADQKHYLEQNTRKCTSSEVSGSRRVSRSFNPKVELSNVCGERVLVFISTAANIPLSSFSTKTATSNIPKLNTNSTEGVQKFVIGNGTQKAVNLDSKAFYLTVFIEQNRVWSNLWENRKFDVATDICFLKKHLGETMNQLSVSNDHCDDTKTHNDVRGVLSPSVPLSFIQTKSIIGRQL